MLLEKGHFLFSLMDLSIFHAQDGPTSFSTRISNAMAFCQCLQPSGNSARESASVRASTLIMLLCCTMLMAMNVSGILQHCALAFVRFCFSLYVVWNGLAE